MSDEGPKPFGIFNLTRSVIEPSQQMPAETVSVGECLELAKRAGFTLPLTVHRGPWTEMTPERLAEIKKQMAWEEGKDR